MRHFSAGANFPCELGYKHLSKIDYSSARAALPEAWRTFTTRRAWLSAAQTTNEQTSKQDIL